MSPAGLAMELERQVADSSSELRRGVHLKHAVAVEYEARTGLHDRLVVLSSLVQASSLAQSSSTWSARSSLQSFARALNPSVCGSLWLLSVPNHWWLSSVPLTSEQQSELDQASAEGKRRSKAVVEDPLSIIYRMQAELASMQDDHAASSDHKDSASHSSIAGGHTIDRRRSR